jgi:hypothetical protein
MSGVTDAAFYVRKEVSDESSQLSHGSSHCDRVEFVSRDENRKQKSPRLAEQRKIYATNPLPATAHFVDGDRIPSKR